MTSSKLFPMLRDFVLEYHYVKFGGNWTTNKGETEGGICPQAYMASKDPSLNRVNDKRTDGFQQRESKTKRCLGTSIESFTGSSLSEQIIIS